MVRRRGTGSANANHAAASWKILIETAKNRQTITSGDLSARLGRQVPRGIGVILDHVGYYCTRQGFPPLTVLAVNGQTGRPGEGWERNRPCADPNEAREAVFDHDWSSVLPPTPEELAEAYRAHRAGQ